MFSVCNLNIIALITYPRGSDAYLLYGDDNSSSWEEGNIFRSGLFRSDLLNWFGRGLPTVRCATYS